MFGIKPSRPVIGLDIGSHGIKAVELEARGKSGRGAYSVARIGYQALPHDAIVEGQIIDAAAVAEAIRSVLDKGKFSGRDVAVSISGNSVIIKRISLPAMETEELAESIIWEAKHNIPYPYEETNVDYAVLKPRPGAGEGMEILLVAVKKDKVAAFANLVSQTRKNLAAIEVDAFALFNAFEINYPEEFAEKTVALVNMGANVTTIVISDHGAPQLFRDLSFGGSAFVENLRKDLGLGLAEAEDLLRGRTSKSVEAFQVDAILALNTRALIDEIDKTFTFYQAEDKREGRIEQILLGGGLANLKTIAASFEQKFGAKTTLFDPFRRVHYNEKRLGSEYYQEMAPFFGVAVGLATRPREK